MPTKTKPQPKKKPAAAKRHSEQTPPAPEQPAQNEAPTAITAPEDDNALSMILKTRVKLDDTSLTMHGETTFEEWREVYAFAEKLNERGKWWLGDIIHFAEGKFPDRYTQAIDATGLSYSRLTTIVSVCGRIEPARRRKEAKFSFHELIAYIPYQTGDHLLDRAIKEKWTHEELADAVARSKGEPTKAERKAAKEAKANGGVKVLPNSANGQMPSLPLQKPEPAKFWNGYEVLTRDRGLSAPSLLPDEEADRCANNAGFPHAQAMMNWLEEHNFRKEVEPCPTTTTASMLSPSSPASAVISEAAGSATTSDAQSTVGSNGAAPEPTEPAPTPQIAATPAPPARPAGQNEAPATTTEQALEIAISERDALKFDIAELIAERDDARDQLKRYELATDMEAKRPAIERAEAAIRAFNAASKEVDWRSIRGLQRLKWLGRGDKQPGLLTPADEAIDQIQGQPPTARK